MPLFPKSSALGSCLLSWLASHHSIAMLTCLKFCFSTSLWHFPSPNTFRHFTLTRQPRESQSDYNVTGFFTISRAVTHKRLKLDLFQQENILVINMSLLFCSLSIIARIRRLLFPGNFSSEIFTSKPQGVSLSDSERNQCYLKTSPDSIMLAGALGKESVFPLGDLVADRGEFVEWSVLCWWTSKGLSWQW